MKPNNVYLNDDRSSVVILDQTKIPNEEVYIELRTPKEMFDAIFELKVRGAPAIGICAGYSIYILAKNINTTDYNEFLKKFTEYKDYLNSSRPTAVNLSWALNRMEDIVKKNESRKISEIVELLEQEAVKIQEEDIQMCKEISKLGLSLLKKGDGILTHCNAGPMATSLYGTGLGPILLGQEEGYEFKAFVDETRPLLQGARLTSYELNKAGVDTTLICDNMASIVMKNGSIQACLVGCDRIAANGDVANKIGTSGVAILAKYYNIPFYVLGPTSTLDMECLTGDDIEIELRDGEEIKTKFYEKPMAPKDVKTYNPAFDVTDHKLITAIITEKGICRPPYKESLLNIVNQ